MIDKILFIVLINLIFFFKTLKYKYSSDDIPVERISPKNLVWYKRLYKQIEGSIRVTPQQDHLVTMIIHTLVCVFIYTGFGYNNISFLAALLFSFNPINNQASVWISGRGYALPTLFMLMAMTFPAIGLLFLMLAVNFNAGFFAPLALGGSIYSWMACILPLIWLFHWKRFKRDVNSKISQEMFGEDKKIKPEKLVLAIKTFGFYTLHAILPIKTTFYHSFLQSAAGSGKDKAYSLCRFFWIGIVITLAILTYFICFTWNIASFGLLWWCIGIAPFCNLIRLNQEIAERYTYLPLVGLMVALSTVLVNNPIIASMFIAMYATKLWFYMDAYTDDFWLVEYASLNSPDSWFAWHIKAMKRWDMGSHKEALTLWIMAKIISPKELKVLFNIATVLKLGGNNKEAEEYIKMAENNIPEGQEEAVTKLIADWRKGKLTVLL